MAAIESEFGGELIKSGELGSVTNRNVAFNLEYLSSVLPTGTEIFKYYVSPMMILAELNGELILYCTAEDEMSFTIYSPFISENFTDYVIVDNILYVNIANDPQWISLNYNYIKGDYIGKVLKNSDERNIYKLEDFTANLLPIGTKLYEFDEDPLIILADTADGLIPYLKIVEG
jgi:hypothetical protein